MTGAMDTRVKRPSKGRRAVLAVLESHGIPVRSLDYTPARGSDGILDEGGWCINGIDGFANAEDVARYCTDASGVRTLARGDGIDAEGA